MPVQIQMEDGNAYGGKPVRLFGPVRWNEFEFARDGRLLAVVLEQVGALKTDSSS